MFCDIFENFSPLPKEYYFIHSNEQEGHSLGFRKVYRPNEREDDSWGLREVHDYELEYIIRGTGKIIVDGETLPACDHSLHFRRPGMKVEGIGIYQSYYIEFYLNSKKEQPDVLNAMPNWYLLEEYTEIEQIFSAIFHDYFDETVTQLLTYKIHVLQLFEIMVNDWYHRTQNVCLAPTVVENIYRAIHYFETHLSEQISLQKMAEISGYSQYHFARIFKQLTSQTPVQYLTRLRISQAKRLLVETTLTTEEILSACGFNNYSYFFRVFKEACGITPHQYRKKHERRVRVLVGE